jgi:hypothetical protein
VRGVKPYPLSVTPDGVLFGGRHRLEAFKAEGITEALMHISQPMSLDREAIELNRASEDSLPMTFVDEAELIWRKLANGQTQQAIAVELKWSRSSVADFAQLSKISPEAWKVVATFLEYTLSLTSEAATTNVAAATKTEKLFTEYGLRSIIGLEPSQQLELVKDLAEGKITKGKFSTQAELYRYRNEARDWFLAQAGGLDEELIDEGVAGIGRGLYDAEWKASKGAGAKLTKLLESSRERHHKKHSISLVNGDFYAEVKKIGNDSIDAIITDPPYNISTERI